LSKSIWNGVFAGARELGLVVRDVLATVHRGAPPAAATDPAGASPTAAGGRRRRSVGSRDLLLEPVSKSAPAIAWTSKCIMLCPAPHSSAHWPWKVPPASSSLSVNSKLFVRPARRRA
jgi:hypothetical protein